MKERTRMTSNELVDEISREDEKPFGKWQSIESAPKDGQEILTLWPLYRGAKGVDVVSGVPRGPRMAISSWYSYEEGERSYRSMKSKPHEEYGWWQTLSGQRLAALDDADGPSHWMPLPPLP